MHPTPAMQPTSPAGLDSAPTWTDLLNDPAHTGQTWACLAAAIGHADKALRLAQTEVNNPNHPALTRGGRPWRHDAVAAYLLLHASGAYHQFATDPPGRCVADSPAARAWLQAPSGQPDHEADTVADSLGVDEDFLVDDEQRPARVNRLLHAAQAAGVLRCEGASVELWHMADDDGDLDGHRIAVRHDDGIVLASGLLAIDDFSDDGLCGVEAAVDALTQTALIANEILTAAARAQARPTTPAPSQSSTATHTDAGIDDTPRPLPAWVQGFRPTGARPVPAIPSAAGPPAAHVPPPVMGRPPQGPSR